MRYQKKCIALAKKYDLTLSEEAGTSFGYPLYKVKFSGLTDIEGNPMTLTRSSATRREAYRNLYKVSKDFVQSNQVVYKPGATTINLGPR